MTPLWEKLLAQTVEMRETGLKRLKNAASYARQTGALSPDRVEKIAGYAAAIGNDPELLEDYLKIFAVFHAGAPEEVLNEPLPSELCSGFEEKKVLLVVAMALLPTAAERFEKAGLPVSKLCESCDEIEAWIANCERNYGVAGLEYEHGFAWLTMRLFTCQVLRFGRLEYNKTVLFRDIMVISNCKDGKKLVVLTENYAVNASGLVTAPGEETVFTTRFSKDADGTIHANVVRPDGVIESDTTTFSPDEWEIYLAPGDPVIYMHIPEVGPLNIDAVKASYPAVREFYRQYYPDYPVKAIVSHSWLFDPVLQQLLPESSNLCQYQRTGNILPRKGPSDAVRRVFGQPAVDNGIETVEWKSSLQKSLGSYLKSGGYCRGGGIIILE